MLQDIKNKAVIITGATKGIGLATAKEFAKHGAHCYITHAWGSVEPQSILDEFAGAGYTLPCIIQSDVANEDDIAALIYRVHQDHPSVYAFISNVSFALLTKSLNDYSERGLYSSIEYSAWPLVSIVKQIKKQMDNYPRYVIATSSNGADSYHMNYDFVAVAKAIMETMVKYLNYHLIGEPIHFNILRAGYVDTDSLRATFGEDCVAFIRKYQMTGTFIDKEDVARAICMLCSGLMDGVRGEIVNVDGGFPFADNIMRYYEERQKFNL